MDYSRGKIYRLVVGGSYYIGSTVSPLKTRLYGHRQMSQKHPHLKLYQAIQTEGWENVKIELMEEYPCASFRELIARETTYIRLEDPLCLNARKALLEDEERETKKRIATDAWRAENPDRIKEHAARSRAKLRADPAKREAQRVYQREYMRKRRAVKP